MTKDQIDGRDNSPYPFSSADLGPTSVLLNPGLEGDVAVAYDVPKWGTDGTDQNGYFLHVEVGYIKSASYIMLTGTNCSSPGRCDHGNP